MRNSIEMFYILIKFTGMIILLHQYIFEYCTKRDQRSATELRRLRLDEKGLWYTLILFQIFAYKLSFCQKKMNRIKQKNNFHDSNKGCVLGKHSNGAAEDWTPVFSHAKRALYHWVTTPFLLFTGLGFSTKFPLLQW